MTTDRARDARKTEALTLSQNDDFEAIFLEHWPRIYSVLRRLVGDPAEAEDLALETFWRLHERPPRMTDKLRLGGWLYRVASNLGLNAIRGGKRRERYEIDAGGWDPARDTERDDPVQQAAKAEQRRRVRQVLSELSPRQARLLILRHSGLTYKELASTLAVSPESIGTLLTRAEAEFERQWKEGGDE